MGINEIEYNKSLIFGSSSWMNKMSPSLLQRFVPKRVKQSLRNPEFFIENWRDVKSEGNAADLVSRGTYPGIIKIV